MGKRRGKRREHGPSPVTYALWAVGALAGAASVALVVAVVGMEAQPVAGAGTVAESGFAASTTSTIAPVAPLDLPHDPSVLVFGDASALGRGIEGTDREAYPALLAERMGWTDVRLDAAAGTGVAATSDRPAYPERLEATPDGYTPDLVILQGSVDDMKPGVTAVRSAVTRMLGDIAERWPDAQVVIVTPVTGELSYEPLADAYSAPAAGAAHVIDATGPQSWLPLDRPDLRTGDRGDPSAAGHDAVAAGLQASLDAIGA